MKQQFIEDVKSGLNASPKFLSSKYFYNKIGDALFKQIMHLPEYYLTRSELEIFQQQTQSIIEAFALKNNTHFELIELGAGDGLKTKELLSALLNLGFYFDYIPIDISNNALSILEESLKNEFPTLSVKPLQGEYFEVLAKLKTTKSDKIILLLGSNLGNMLDETASDFIYRLGVNLKKNDKLLLGLDLIKSKQIVLPAYNDSRGITKAFNLNLLTRINTELDADFDVSSFVHYPEYEEEEGIAKSYLVSTKDQIVTVGSIGESFQFEKNEKIFMEISRKYTDTILNKILAPTDFKIIQKLTDSKQYFANYILNRIA